MSSDKSNLLVNAREKELLSRAEYNTYVQTEQGECSAYCFRPAPVETPGHRYPVIIFFHGGLFDQRLTGQFAPHCLHFASRGMLAFSVEYRTSEFHQTTPVEALEDARNFLNFLNTYQDHYQADMSRLVVAGNAGGGLLASHLCSRHKKIGGILDALPRPAAQILYSPLINTTSKGIGADLFADPKMAKLVSPSELIEKDYPPTIAFHGKADTVIPFSLTERYMKNLQKKKNQAEFVDFETGRHIDFNLNVNPQLYGAALRSADYFLADLGIIPHDEDALLDF